MDLTESIHRIQQSDVVFGKKFYGHLFQKHPEARRFFEGIDMHRQSIIFTMQLAVVGAFHERRTSTAEQYLQVLGTQRRKRGIPREMYGAFRDCLLEMLSEFHGDDWNAALAAQWARAMNAVSEKMWEGYEARFHV
jgi:hemoglobin-like flavoprotein